MILTIPDTKAHLPEKARVIDKPNSELQMIVRRALEQTEIWEFFYAYQELDRRSALNPELALWITTCY